MEARRKAHWAWQPVRATVPPTVEDEAWVEKRVDRFILARLEAAGLRPAPAADRRSLLRRVHFALLGLPPTARDVEDFVADPAPDALERVVDRLLASPQFGERWARHWMDLVRYSDTLGNEADKPIPNAWRYRDYLVRAFNADLPYDRLILEHLAGDLLDDPRRRPDGGDNESVIGTSFFWMSEGKRSPVDLRQALADTFDNRLDVMSKAFLGLTVACARCHDHKFDAITQEDYYGLGGYLKSSRYTQAMLNRAEIDARVTRLAAIRAEIGREAGAALATQAATIPRYLMAALRVLSDGSRRSVERGGGARPGTIAVLGGRVEGDRPGSGRPDVCLASDRGSRGRADHRSGRGPLARSPGGGGGEGRQGWRDATRGGYRAGRLRRIGLPGLVRRGPGLRTRTAAAGRHFSWEPRPPDRSPRSSAAGRGRIAGVSRVGCKARCDRRRSRSTAGTCTSWRRGGPRG